MPQNERYFIGPGLRDKLRDVITRVGGTPDNVSGATIPTRLQTMGGPAGKVFRVCTFTGAWSINSQKTVTFKYQTATPNTVSATNLFAAIATAASSRNCAVARDGTAWYLIAAEC